MHIRTHGAQAYNIGARHSRVGNIANNSYLKACQMAEVFLYGKHIQQGLAGVLVLWLGTSWPDLVAGALIAAVAFKGGIEILQSVREDKRSDSNDPVA